MKRLVWLFSFLLIVAVVSEFTLLVHADGEAWLEGWTYRKSHLILNATGAGTNYQVQIIVINGSGSDSGNTVYIDNKTRSDFGDVRFTDNDGNTVLDYCVEILNVEINMTSWVEVQDDSSSANVTIYMYYGKASATTLSNGETTFLLYDHFADSSINTTIWATAGSPTESGTAVLIDGSNERIYSKTSFNYKAVRFSLKVTTWATLIDLGFTIETAGGTTGERFVGYATPTMKVISGQGAGYTITDKGSQGTAYKTYDIKWASGSAKFLINDASETEHTTNVHTGTVPLQFLFFPSSGTGIFYVDWVFVRNYVKTEPGHSTWGTEETRPLVYATFGFSNGVLLVNGTEHGNDTIAFTYLDTMNLIMAVEANYTFFNWTYDGSSSTSNPFNLSITTNLTITAYVGLANTTETITLPGTTVTETVWHPLVYVAIGIAVICMGAVGVEEKRKH